MSLKALFINCTLKYSPEASNTFGLIEKVASFMQDLDVETEIIRATDFKIYYGITAEKMRDDDQWPEINEKVKACDILVIGTPIWMGVRSSVCQLVIERIDGGMGDVDKETGQYPYYNKVGGVIITGNEDGAHDCASNTLFNLSHFGFTIPANCDSYWVGDAGPGPNYLDDGGGKKHLYTNRTARFMAHNIVHMAKILKDNPYPININELTDDAKKESNS
jgi:multimeric flavodoxin WrbA